jgi:Eco57I restriction-modification methylase/MmeI, target recognition domain
MPVLERVFPQGLDAHDPDLYRTLRLAFEEWEENQEGTRPNPAIHNAWIKLILKETLGLPDEVLAEGQSIPATLKATVAEHGETLRPDLVVQNPEDGSDTGKPRLLIQVYPLDQSLEKPVTGRHWKASPATRMMELLHGTDVRLGLVTNGEHWMLVDAPRNETTGFASWYASLWLEEKITLQAFRSLLGVHRFFSVSETETLQAMLAESAKHQQEVTEQLGLQVRRAVEVIIQSLDRADQDHGRQLLGKVPETVLYEAALTVMMRLVILFCAEERGMLLLGDPLYDEHYAVSTLVAQLQEAADQHGEEVLERRLDAWARLLATFRAVFGGVEHERMKLPPYAGNLFNPDRFPFLEGRRPGTLWRNTLASPLPVNNRTVLHLLRSLQYLELHGEARRLSFRALDIEQIGHVYEGLLDHTARRATEPVLGLIGAKGQEPELALSELEQLKTKSEDKLVEFLKEETHRSENALRKALDPALETEEINRLRAACGNDDALFKQARPFEGIIRDDTFGRPVVIPKGGVYVTAGTDRRSSGTHYTPRSLTEPIVQYTLEPLVYIGPAEGKPREDWKLRSPRELLDLKICDMACGSGAFLVQACRYLSDHILEAWEKVEAEHPGTSGISPEGNEATGRLGETLIPKDPDERLVYAKRLIAQRCLYGVDKNPLAAEMAKLSLWLLTLSKAKPFTFLDHAIRCGDSLVGVRDVDQLKYFTLDLQGAQQTWFTGPVLKLADEAVALRQKISSTEIHTVADVEAEERLLAEVDEKTIRLRYAADLLISVEFKQVSTGEKEDWRNSAAIQAGQYVAHGSIAELAEAAHRAMQGIPTFHWPLVFPEVMIDRGGFDAFVGNPPFLTGKRISSILGASYESYLKNTYEDSKGAADICTFFIRRAFTLTARHGKVGMIATKSVAEGDSRDVGIGWILNQNGSLYWVWHEVHWPGLATVVVSLVIISRTTWTGINVLNHRTVRAITSRFIEGDEVDCYPLLQNKGSCSDGVKIQGDGFIISNEERNHLISADRRNKDVIRPYITGMDMVQGVGCIPRAWIISFGTMSYEEASEFTEPFAVLVERVKPYRQSLMGQIHEADFWKFWDKRELFFQRMRKHVRILACPSTSKYLIMAFIDKSWVASHSVKLFAFSDDSAFSVMQSAIHEAWAREHSGKLRVHLAYNLTKAFASFPWPSALPNSDVGFQLGDIKAAISEQRQLGFTDIYNLYHDPDHASTDIQRLRDLHVEMDCDVATAYGWTDLKLDHGFYETKEGIQFTVSEDVHREILARLLRLNHERYAEEVRQGLHEKKKKAKGSANANRSRGALKTASNTAFFSDDDNQEEPEPQRVGKGEATQTYVNRPSDGQQGRQEAQKEDKAPRSNEHTTPLDTFNTDEVMAAFRQAARGQGAVMREELLKEVSTILGYQRLGSKVDETLRGHLRAAIRRGIIEDDAGMVRAATTTMNDYSLEELRTALCSVMRKGTNYEREEATYAAARHLGFARVTDSVREAIKSAINSGIRQGILGYDGSLIWREE